MIRHLPNKLRAVNINIRVKYSPIEKVSVIGLGVADLRIVRGKMWP